MFFRKQKFFLDLTGPHEGDQDTKAAKDSPAKVTIAPPPTPAVVKEEKAPANAAVQPAAAPAAVEAAAPAAAATPAPTASAVRTTAEEIAAQLAAEAASRPAPTLATFAPDCLAPGASTPRRRRSAGANLGAFKEIARGLMKS